MNAASPYQYAIFRMLSGLWMAGYFVAQLWAEHALPIPGFAVTLLLVVGAIAALALVVGWQRHFMAAISLVIVLGTLAQPGIELLAGSGLWLVIAAYLMAPMGEPWAVMPRKADWKLPKGLQSMALFFMVILLLIAVLDVATAESGHLWHLLTNLLMLVPMAVLAIPASWLKPVPAGNEVPIVYFDGYCGLCNNFIDFLFEEDRHDILKFSPIQGDTAAKNFPEGELQQFDSIGFARDGKLYFKSTAALMILRQIGGIWRLLWVFRFVPAPLRNLAYDIVAANRYKWFGKHETCRMPTPEERAKLLP